MPPDAWDDAFGADVTAAKFDLTFPDKIKPGQRVDITFQMQTPLVVAQVSDPTIAWNSFAHAETTDRGGRPNVLPVTEPIQVGVATSYGSLKLQKKIGSNPGNLSLEGREFEFNVLCTTTPQGGTLTTVVDKTVDVSATAPSTIADIPAGASCSVWETDAQGGISSNGAANPVVVDIAPMLGTDATIPTATITNSYPLAKIAVTKVVDGAAAEFAPTSFPVDITCAFDGVPLEGFNPKSATVTSGTATDVDVPSGSSCTAVETDSKMATKVTYDPAAQGGQSSAPVYSQSGATGAVKITNTYSAGGLVVHKDVKGSGTPEFAQGPFTYEAVCTFNDETITREVTIAKGDGSQTAFVSGAITGLPVGASCTVTETDNGGADYTPKPVVVTVKADENVIVGFTGDNGNRFSSGTVGLSKVLNGAAANETWATDATFRVALTCQRDVTGLEGESLRATVFSGSVAIRGGQRLAAILDGSGNPVKLPVGTRCFGQETETGGATSARVSPASFADAVPVKAMDDPSSVQALMVTATNTFDYGSIELVKRVDGAAAGYVGDRVFTLGVTCVLPQGGRDVVILDAKPFSITAGKSVVINGLPSGARCWASESDRGGATSVAVDYGSRVTSATAGVNVAITVTNTFSAAELVVGKTVVNGAAGPYTFPLACSTAQGNVALTNGDASFQLKHGETRTISVPAGASCVVTEDAVKGATATFIDSDGTNNGTVVVNGRATVSVTNTFSDDSSGNLPDDGGNVPGTPSTPGTPAKPGTPNGSGGQLPNSGGQLPNSGGQLPNSGGQLPNSGGGLPNAGGPTMWLLVLGVMATAGGVAALTAGRRRV